MSSYESEQYSTPPPDKYWLSPHETEYALSCLAMVRTIANELQVENPLLDFDEAVGDGNIGLVMASRGYDPERAAFTTYAYPFIKGAILAGVRRYYGSNLQKPSSLNPHDISLKSTLEPDGEELTLEGTLPDMAFTRPEDIIMFVDIERAMRKLSPQQRSIINLYIQGYTDDEMAYIFSKQPGSIRQQFHKAVAKVRRLASLEPEDVAGQNRHYRAFL
jgi:RNA polymerase sigma factor (sigma-70 family)